jgi:hypothetical protein
MALTKGEAIEIVYLRVNGFRTSAQNQIKREDIAVYLHSAVNYVWGLAAQERLAQIARDKRMGLSSNTSFSDAFQTQYITPQFDKRKKEYFVEVNKISSIGGNLFFQVLPVQGTFPIYNIASRSDLAGLENALGDTAYCYYLYIKNALPRIYLINFFAHSDCELEVTTNFSLSSLSDDDILLVPADKEALMIDKCVQFFEGSQRGDDLIDQTQEEKRRQPITNG